MARHFTDALTRKGYLLFFPQLADWIPEWSGYNKVVEIVKPLWNIFEGVVIDHEKDPADPNHPRDFIDTFLNEIKSTVDPRSSFYKDAGSEFRYIGRVRKLKAVQDNGS